MTASFWPSFLVGALLGAANFFLIVKIVRRMVGEVRPDQKTGRGKIILWVILKLALVATIIVLIVQKGYVRPLALLGGMTASLGGLVLCMTLRGSD